MLRGSCLCGGIGYEVHGKLWLPLNCHCSMCRKATGAAFRSRASVATDDFRWLSGEDLLSRYQSYVASKAPWYEMTDELPQFSAGLPASSCSDGETAV